MYDGVDTKPYVSTNCSLYSFRGISSLINIRFFGLRYTSRNRFRSIFMFFSNPVSRYARYRDEALRNKRKIILLGRGPQYRHRAVFITNHILTRYRKLPLDSRHAIPPFRTRPFDGNLRARPLTGTARPVSPNYRSHFYYH